MMKLPGPLINQVREGRSVLLLGAGATLGALTPDGKKPPIGDELRDRINKNFLEGQYPNETLAWVAELAISATDLFEFQEFVAEQFRDLKPSDFHKLIPTFRWRGIATTNYDRVIESSYNNSAEAVQKIVPFLSNKDRVDQKLRDPSNVGLLKLHGCITHIHDPQLPLILTVDQYATYRKGRERLFDLLKEWGHENTVIFIGQKIQDSNLRSILLELSTEIGSRPRYYLVRPGVTDFERGVWEGKNISVLDGTFEDFLKSLDVAISKQMRPLAGRLELDHPIRLRFVTGERPSPALVEFLSRDYEYVYENITSPTENPARFYSGFGLGWYPILNDLDVRRGLVDKLLDDIILRRDEDRPSQVEFYVIKAEAGAGKSVLLRRLAWDAAIKAGVLCLRKRETSPSSLEPIREIHIATGERIFIFIDNPADCLLGIQQLLDFARLRKVPITLITTERTNEWNIRCGDLEEYLSDQYRLYYLNHSEIENLVRLLTKHNALGPNLVNKNFKEQVDEFEKKAGRQLLVALHEATQGRPFEEILLDEYKNIVPPEAKRLYLSVCVLNRLKVPVRAGLINRVHNIPFDMFRERFFKPLEHVVHVEHLSWGDYAYRARHSEIAQIIFEEVLTDNTERFEEYIRIVRALNPIYSIDLEALRGMLRAKSVHDLFSNYEDAKAIYDAAEQILGKDAYLLQQRGNYERIRPNGNLLLAQALLNEARELAPTDATIVHTLSEISRSRAEASSKKLERARFRNEARGLLQSISSRSSSDSYAAVTQLKLAIDEVRDILLDSSSTNRDIDAAIRAAEQAFTKARQRYPGESFVFSTESEFAQLLKDSERSIGALKKARRANPRDPFIASRLTAILLSRGESEEAKQFLSEALESNRGDRRLNFQYADLLRKEGKSSSKDLAYYYRRAFTKGDDNFESQFWYARFSFESKDPNDVQESKSIFRRLRESPIPYEDRIKIRDVVGGQDNPKKFLEQ